MILVMVTKDVAEQLEDAQGAALLMQLGTISVGWFSVEKIVKYSDGSVAARLIEGADPNGD